MYFFQQNFVELNLKVKQAKFFRPEYVNHVTE